MFGGKQGACASKTGGDFVQNQQDVELVAQRAEGTQVLRMVEPHAASALHNRLQDESGQLFGVGLKDHAVGGHVRFGWRTVWRR